VSDTKYTKVGCGLFSWEPYLNLRRASADGAHLWQMFFMGPTAKTLLPGLWMGGLGTMADQARLTPPEARAALEACETMEMVEFDARTQVLRLTKLPDKGEAAPSPNCLLGWWERRKTIVPDCGVRERHLDLMAWLHLPITPSKRSQKDEMRRVWEETFGAALNVSPVSNLSTTSPPFRTSAPPQSQLDLYATPGNPDMYRDMSRNGPVKDQDQVKGEEEGEVQEREAAPPGDDASTRFGLLELGAPPVETPARVWDAVRARLAIRHNPHEMAMWLEPVEGQIDNGTLRLVVPSTMHRDRLRDKYKTEIETELKNITGREMRIAI
jgi:hypothetical protein